MLIEFSVSNFLSFREKQTLSMVAASRLKKKENILKPGVKGEKLPDLLRVAVVYGPNASGKSNLIKAIGFVSHIINRAQSLESQPLPVSTFRFDSSLANQPSHFEINFISGGQRYEFKLAVTQERVIEEKLTSFPNGKETLLYSRLYTSSGEQYIYGPALEGGSVLHEAWRNLTSPKTLFISQAVINSNEELQQLRIPLSWFQKSNVLPPNAMQEMAEIIQSVATNHPELELDKKLSSFLDEVDIPISGIQFELKKDVKEDTPLLERMKPLNIKLDDFRSFMSSYKRVKTTLTHKTAMGEADFDYSEESDGTKNLIGFCLSFPRKIVFQG